MALTNLVPISRKEKFLDKIAGESVSISPITRLERFLDAIAKGKAGDTPSAPAPITRKEYFLKKIAESFTGGLEMESGSFTAPDPKVSSHAVTFSDNHDRAPDIIWVNLVKDAWVSSDYSTSDIVMWGYNYIGNMMDLTPLSSDTTMSGGVFTGYYNNGNFAYSFGLLYWPSTPANYGTESTATKPERYAGSTGFTIIPTTGTRYLQAGSKYAWKAFWL